MRHIDIHAHLLPQCAWRAFDAGQEWYGFKFEAGQGMGSTVSPVRRDVIPTPKLRFTPEERIQDMDDQGVDVHVVSMATAWFGHHLNSEEGLKQAREVNDEIASMAKQHPTRYAGLATLPTQDVQASIGELDRAVNQLGLKGAELDTVVNGHSWDEPQYMPLFKAAEEMGAILFFHPHPQDNIVAASSNPYTLGNLFGVLVEDVLTYCALVFGGVMEKCPELKVCIAHGAGPACYGMGRLDRGWQVRSEARAHISKPPSHYIPRIYYDTVSPSEAAVRFLIDQVGIDRVVLGSDWPYVPWDPSPGGWIESLESLTPEEKEKILYKNLEELLGI